MKAKKEASDWSIWCIIGEFNCVRRPCERQVESWVEHGSGKRKEFNQFFHDVEVEDIPLIGKKFTWFHLNGRARSQLDGFMVSREWFDTWNESFKYILDRNTLNHCPIILKDCSLDWGPKPFRPLDFWLEDKRFVGFVNKTWNSFEVHSRGVYILKEKLKGLESSLMEWNRIHFGNIHNNIDRIEKAMNKLDKKEDSLVLSLEEVEARKWMQEEFWRNVMYRESLFKQKSRVKWIKESNCNSKFFHIVVNWRRRKNMIRGIEVDKSWVEEHSVVKEPRKIFKDRFSEDHWERSQLDGVAFKQI